MTAAASVEVDYTAEATRIARALVASGLNDEKWAARFDKHPEWLAAIYELAYQMMRAYELGKAARR